MTMDPDLIGLMSLYDEENLDTDRHTEEKAMWRRGTAGEERGVKTEAKARVILPQAKEYLGLSEAGRGEGRIPSFWKE